MITRSSLKSSFFPVQWYQKILTLRAVLRCVDPGHPLGIPGLYAGLLKAHSETDVERGRKRHEREKTHALREGGEERACPANGTTKKASTMKPKYNCRS